MKTIYFFIFLAIISGCVSTNSAITNVLVSGTGADSPNEFCNKFSLTTDQALEFFNKSRDVKVKEFHDNYEYLPCYVEGSLTKGNKKCKFTIRAGGTAELSCNDDIGHLLICDSCDHLLGDT